MPQFTAISGEGKSAVLSSLSLYSMASFTSSVPEQLPACCTVKVRDAPSLALTPSSAMRQRRVVASISVAVPLVGASTEVMRKQGLIRSVMSMSVAPGLVMFSARSSKRSFSSSSLGVTAT